MSALRASSDPSREAVRDLLTAMNQAYEQVQIARRTLVNLEPPSDLCAFLRSAEADLVRGLVIAQGLELTVIAGDPADRLVSIEQHRSALSPSA